MTALQNYDVTIRDGIHTDQRIVSAHSRSAARWSVVDALLWCGWDTRDALRAVSVRRTKEPTTEEALQAECTAWNAAHPVGTRVRYWTWLREGDGAVGEVRAPAEIRGGSVVVWVDTYHSCVAVSHVEALP